MNFNIVVFWVMCVPGSVIGTVSIMFEPSKPPLADAVGISCKLTASSSSSITWNFESTSTSCGSGLCAPDPSPYTYSMSGNEFNLTLSSATIGHCITYYCQDFSDAADITSNDLYVAYFDKNEISTTEPGANTDGPISVTTGCVLSAPDLTVKWYKIENGIERDYTVDGTTSERSTCSRTCHSEEDKKVTGGFTHTEYTGSDFVEVEYKVTISHSSYTDPFSWTSAKYRLKVLSDSDVCECSLSDCKCEKSSDECIWCWKMYLIVLGMLLLLFFIGVIIGLCIIRKEPEPFKGCLNCEASHCSECCQRCDNNIIRCKCCCSCWNIENAPFWYYILWWTVTGIPVAFGIFIIMKLKHNEKTETEIAEEQSMTDIKTAD